jgi:hypothetical protein
MLINNVNKDEELREWFKSLNSYVHKVHCLLVCFLFCICLCTLLQVLLQEGYVLEPNCNNGGNQIHNSGCQFYDGKYKKHFDNLFSSVSDWFKAMGEDPTNKCFGEDWVRLTKDLLFDSEGSLKFKPHLCSDIQKVIVLTLVDQVCIALLFVCCVSY